MEVRAEPRPRREPTIPREWAQLAQDTAHRVGDWLWQAGEELARRRDAAPRPSGGSGAGWVGLGGALALVGCFLPLMAAAGESLRIVPHVVDRVDQAWALPLAAGALIMVSVLLMARDRTSRSVLAGAAIALSSPCLVLGVLVKTAAEKVMPWIGLLDRNAGVGAGCLALLLGFGLALVGGFTVLWRNSVDDDSEYEDAVD